MPARRLVTTVPANGVVANILAGEDIEFPGRPSTVEVAWTTVAAAAGDITLDVQFGSDLVGQALIVSVEAAVGRGPVLADDLLISEVAAGEDRLVLRLTNGNVAAQEVTTYIRVEPLV